MFLMFRLGRPNVLPDLDLGVQKGIQHAYRLAKLPSPKDVLRIGERWAPYASVASWYMWRLLELPEVIRKEARARSAARSNQAATGTPRTAKSTTATASARKTPKPASKHGVTRKATLAKKTTARGSRGKTASSGRTFRAVAAKKSAERGAKSKSRARIR